MHPSYVQTKVLYSFVFLSRDPSIYIILVGVLYATTSHLTSNQWVIYNTVKTSLLIVYLRLDRKSQFGLKKATFCLLEKNYTECFQIFIEKSRFYNSLWKRRHKKQLRVPSG